MKNKRNKKQQDVKTNILLLPNKLNILTMFAIFIVYGLVLFAIIGLAFPKVNYTVPLNYEPSTYNDEINPFALVIVITEYDEDEDEYNSRAKAYAYIRAMNNNKITRADYAYSAIDTSGIMRYFIETHRNSSFVTPPVSHRTDKEPKINGALDKIFIKTKYRITIDDKVQTKEIRFSEKVMQLTNRDLNDSKYTLTNAIEDKLDFKIEFTDEGTSRYYTKLEINLVDKTKPHHINFQTWLVTEDNHIFPFIGLYNFCSEENFTRTTSEGFYKTLNPEWLYARLVYTDPITGEVDEIYYRTKVSSLIANK